MPTSHPAATAILILGSLGALAGCNDDSPEARADSTSPTASTSPTESIASETPIGPQHISEGLPGVLTPGPYLFSFLTEPGATAPEALVTVADGFTAGATWFIVPPDGNQFLGTYVVARVKRDACGTRNGFFDPGPSVKDLADALVAQKSTRSSVPKPVTLDGHQGLYVEMASPSDLDTCTNDRGLWDGRGIYTDGQVDKVWILDVDGQRLVVDASYAPSETTRAQINTLTSMAKSLAFVPAE